MFSDANKKIIAVTGRDSKNLSNLLATVVNKCKSHAAQIDVVWGNIKEINELSGEVEMYVAVTPEYDSDIYDIDLKSIKCLVLPYSSDNNDFLKNRCDCEIYKYAIDQNKADIVAKNLNHADQFTSFELLFDCSIGRIKFSNEKNLAALNVLACAGAMIACGIDFKEIIEAFKVIG